VRWPWCSKRAPLKSPSTLAGVALCRASAWCDPRQAVPASAWHAVQAALPM
jgi:hypothetical protein